MADATEPDMVPSNGRVKQKERTRQALLTAARTLLANNERLTIARAAELASVSEATAYRYYSDTRTLLRDALVLHWQQLGAVVAELKLIAGVEARARYAAEALAHVVLQNEADVRALIAMSYAPGALGSSAKVGDIRPGFRIALVDAVLAPLGKNVDGADMLRLKRALLVIIGAEAVLGLKDATDCSIDEVAATLGWCAHNVAASALRTDLRTSPAPDAATLPSSRSRPRRVTAS